MEGIGIDTDEEPFMSSIVHFGENNLTIYSWEENQYAARGQYGLLSLMILALLDLGLITVTYDECVWPGELRSWPSSNDAFSISLSLKELISVIYIIMRCSSFVMSWETVSLLANMTLHLIIIDIYVMIRER